MPQEAPKPITGAAGTPDHHPIMPGAEGEEDSFLSYQTDNKAATAAVAWGLGALSFSVDFPVDGSIQGGVSNNNTRSDMLQYGGSLYTLPKSLDDDREAYRPPNIT
eukprot:scaffold40763_cov49-Prasinocladus_malaysianus.AAC.1